MAAIQELVGSIRLDASEVKKGVSEAQSGIQGLGDKAASVGQNMQSAGKKMTMGVTTPLVAMGATAVSQAATFESAMTESIAIMGDVSEAERTQLEETARDVAKSTTMSHEQSAESYYFLASAGLDAAESMEAMPKVAEYAESAQLDMSTATDYATDIMSAFGYEAEELTTVTDTLTQTVSNHNTTADQMGTAMSYVAPVANSLGISIQETSSALGMFSDVGIKGSKAGTALRGVLSSLADPTEKQKDLLEELGVNVNDAQGNMLPLVDIVKQLEQAGAETGDVMALFGRQAGPAMAALLQEGSDALDENTKALEDAEGATKAVAQTQRDTLMGSLQILKSNVADLAITFGAEFVPYIRMAADAASGLAEKFGTLSPTARRVIIVAAGLAAAIGPLLFVFGTLLTMVPSLIAGWGALTGALAGAGVSAGVLGSVLAALTGPIGILIGAVALLAAAWASDFGGIRGHTMRVVGVLREELAPAINWLKGVATKVLSYFGGEGASSFASFSAAAKPVVGLIADGLIVAIRGLASVTRSAISGMVAAWQVLGPAVMVVLDAVVTGVQNFATLIGGIINVATALWKGDWSGAWAAIFDTTVSILNNIIGFFQQFFPGLKQITGLELLAMKLRWAQFGQNLYKTALNAFNRVKGVITSVLSTLQAIFGPTLSQLQLTWAIFSLQIRSEAAKTWNAVRAKIAPFINWLQATVPPVLVAIQAKWAQFSTIVRSAASMMAGGVRSVVTALLSYIRGRFFATLSAISGFWSVWGSDITAVARQTGATAKTIIVGWMDLIKSAIIIGLRLIRGDWAGAWEAIVGITGRTTGRIKSILTGWASVLAGVVNTLVERIIGFFQRLYQRLVGGSIVPEMANAIIRVFTNLKERAEQKIRDMATRIVGYVTSLRNKAVRKGRSLKDRFVGKMSELKSAAERKIAALMRRLVDIVRAKISEFKNSGKALVRAFTRGINSLKNAPKNAAKKVVGKVRDLLPSSDAEEGPLSDLSRTGPALVETFAAGIEGQRGRVERAARLIAEAARSELNTEASMSIGVRGAGRAPATPQYANFDALADAAVKRRGEYDAAAVSDVLSEYGEGNLFRLAEEMSKAAEIKTSAGNWGTSGRGTFRMDNPFTDVKATFRQLKAAAEDSSKMSQALYDSFTRRGQFGFVEEMEDIFNRAIEARKQGMVQAEDGTWVDPSFYSGRPRQRRTQASAYSIGEGAAAQDRATGEQIAQAVRDVLAGSKIEVDVEDEELVDRATLRVEEQRRQNVRSSIRSP